MDVHTCSSTPSLNLSPHYHHGTYTRDPLQGDPPTWAPSRPPAVHDAVGNMTTGFVSPAAFVPPPPAPNDAAVEPAATSAPMTRSRKRKAESQENERLSKRLSLLNLEKNGQKLYVPVESPYLGPTTLEDYPDALPPIPEDDTMRLDDNAHKVYIYNIDDELSSSDTESTCSNEDNNHRLIFLADIDKHLRHNRIPPSVFASPDGEIAGKNINDMQVVLYSDPSSLTVPEQHDSVRRAVIEARNRMRQKLKDERDGLAAAGTSATSSSSAVPSLKKAWDSAKIAPTISNTTVPWAHVTDEMELD